MEKVETLFLGNTTCWIVKRFIKFRETFEMKNFVFLKMLISGNIFKKLYKIN